MCIIQWYILLYFLLLLHFQWDSVVRRNSYWLYSIKTNTIIFDTIVVMVVVNVTVVMFASAPPCDCDQHRRRGAVQLRRGLRAPGQQNHQLSARGRGVRRLERPQARLQRWGSARKLVRRPLEDGCPPPGPAGRAPLLVIAIVFHHSAAGMVVNMKWEVMDWLAALFVTQSCIWVIFATESVIQLSDSSGFRSGAAPLRVIRWFSDHRSGDSS